MKGHCVKSLKMLSTCGVNDLHDDGFEGSINEHHIFTEVFFGHESSKTDEISKNYNVTGAINFENEKKTPTEISFCSDSGSSVMTNQEDFQNMKEDFGEFALFTRNDHCVEVKRRKMSPVEHFETKSNPEMVVSSSVSSKVVNSNSDDQKTYDVSNAIPAPVQVSKKRWKDSSFIELDKDELLIPPKDSATNPKPILRYYSYCLLKAAGWLIGRRNKKGHGEYMFKTPEGRPIREFRRSWTMCGQKLVNDAKYIGVCNGMRWAGLSQFVSDLSNALTEVEKLRNSGTGTTTALAHWWYLLDPFAKVVFIDRSLPDLKQGKEVKAKRSAVNYSRSSKPKKHRMVQKEKKVKHHVNDDDLLLSAILTNRSTNKRVGIKRKYKSKKGKCRLVPRSSSKCSGLGASVSLICCDNCRSTFHQECLSTQELPEGNWYCSKCCCNRCGNVAGQIDASVSNALKCLQCELKYHEECIKENRIEKSLVGPTWFCGETCEKIHSSLDSQIGCVNPLSDGYSWTLLKCIQGDQKVHSGQHFDARKAECNLKLAVALTIMEECFIPMVDTRTGIYMLPHVLYNQGSEYVRLNYAGFYTVILEKDDVLLCVASLRIHGATVAELPLIATCSRYRRQGMCRRLMTAIEEMLKSFKVEKLVVSAIPSLVETWTDGFGFTHLEADEKKSLDKTNLMVLPGTVWLKKPMHQVSTQHTHFLGTATATEGVSSDINGDLEEAHLVDIMPVYDTQFLQALENRYDKLVEQVSFAGQLETGLWYK
ncbi:putative histone acetyltransferase chromatin regulator PHD family [Helianthus annuus]|nr:putative histone acetyltransferase chromatin regulator PHD family [Helianthus annuus]KAJ0684432.1 putative histone acetyltransferase chromatin regulator PHD family [Helianthus annuus]KAJ0688373.1 putative histone acetyltransferase chromatin regulator PHD family [Helianthus annuus]